MVLYTVVLKIAKNVFGEDSQKMCLQTMANVKEVALKESYIDAHKYPTWILYSFYSIFTLINIPFACTRYLTFNKNEIHFRKFSIAKVSYSKVQ